MIIGGCFNWILNLFGLGSKKNPQKKRKRRNLKKGLRSSGSKGGRKSFGRKRGSVSDNDPLTAYKNGEEARKERDVERTIELLMKSCVLWINHADRTNQSPAPAPFRELAKLYYHTHQDDKAISVLGDYLASSKGTRSGNLQKKREELTELRERLATGDFQRQTHMYEEYINKHPELTE